MALARPWRALVGWLGHLFGRERQTWVEPGNAITRAVLSGVELALPDLPVRRTGSWAGDPSVGSPGQSSSADRASERIEPGTAPPPPSDGEPKPGRSQAA